MHISGALQEKLNQRDMALCVQDIVSEVPAAKDLFSQASDILGYDLLNLCTEGDASHTS